MRRLMGALGGSCVLMIATAGAALAHGPQPDPLPVNGEPHCFGARVSHSASRHDLTPKVKVSVTETFLAGADPEFFPEWQAYYADNGVSVRSVQMWIRINCSDNPIVPNP
jgi:hypothetical protein